MVSMFRSQGSWIMKIGFTYVKFGTCKIKNVKHITMFVWKHNVHLSKCYGFFIFIFFGILHILLKNHDDLRHGTSHFSQKLNTLHNQEPPAEVLVREIIPKRSIKPASSWKKRPTEVSK